MERQTEFPFIAAPVPLNPVETRLHPAVWVEKLAVYKGLPVGGANRLRVITLRRGMNILWAEPGAQRARGEPRARVSGHATGKTTFCRLIRYILGEPSFGSETFRAGFRKKFDQGWVFGEVWVDRRRWLVGRPLGIGPQGFAVKNGRIEDLEGLSTMPRDALSEYRKAIESAVLGDLRQKELPATGELFEWDMLLQWMARDQESRFGGLLNWRHTSSDSRSMELQEAAKENVVRLSLGLASDTEQGLMRDFSLAAAKHKTAIGKRSNLEYQIRTEITRLANLLKIEISDESPLPEEAVRQKISELEREAERVKQRIDQDETIQRLRNEQNSAVEAMNSAHTRWTDAKETAEALQEEIDVAEGNKKEAERAHKKRDWMPFRNHCSQPLTDEVRRECRYARLRKPDDALDAELETLRNETNPLKLEKAYRDRDVMRFYRELEACKAEAERLKQELETAESPYEPDQKRAAQLTDTATTARIHLQNLTGALQQREDNERAIVECAQSKAEIDRKLEAEKAQHGARMRDFSNLFEFVVRELLGSDVTAGVNFSGKTIQPYVNYHGRLDSAALETVRLLAFDIASLTEGYIRDAARLPRLLIHDSPREADLSVDIYHSLFRLMERLETEAGDVPPFQYIITTTEPPPDGLRQSPWLLEPVLRTTNPESRLLGVDL